MVYSSVEKVLLVYNICETVFVLILLITLVYLLLSKKGCKFLRCCRVRKCLTKTVSNEEKNQCNELYATLSKVMAHVYEGVTGLPNKEEMEQNFFTELIQTVNETGNHLYKEIDHAVPNVDYHHYEILQEKRNSWGSRSHLKFLDEKRPSSKDKNTNTSGYLEAKCFISKENCPENLKKLCNLHARQRYTNVANSTGNEED
jgi:ribosomal protein L30E